MEVGIFRVLPGGWNLPRLSLMPALNELQFQIPIFSNRILSAVSRNPIVSNLVTRSSEMYVTLKTRTRNCEGVAKPVDAGSG